jgi:hypothetical protein
MTSERNEAPFSLWSFLRSVLSQGADIHLDHQGKGYELYSARLDEAAREREEQLTARLQPARVPEGSVLVRESMLRHWLRELNAIRNGSVNATHSAEHVHASIASVLAAAPAPEADHSCRNCLGVDPASCVFNHKAETAKGEEEDPFLRLGRVVSNLPSGFSFADAVEHADTVHHPAPEAPAAEWRCFHCDERFTGKDAAALHFGTHEYQEPACLIDIAKYREMEALQLRYNDEDADVHRTMRRMETEHQQALRRAEEDGYSKGLSDAAKYPYEAGILAQPAAGQGEGVDGRAKIKALATEIAEAVLEDEQSDGCDISLGLLGPKFSAIIRRLASAQQPASAGWSFDLGAELLRLERIAGAIGGSPEIAESYDREALALVSKMCRDRGRWQLACADRSGGVGEMAVMTLGAFLDAAEAAMKRHRLQGWTCEDGEPMPLADMLTSEGKPISEGWHQINLICDSIMHEVERRQARRTDSRGGEGVGDA